MRNLGVGTKVVAPFVGLTLLVGLLVSAVAGQELAVLGAQQQLLLATRAEDNVNTVFNSIEERQLAELRLFTVSPELAGAVAASDQARLRGLLLPLVAEQLPVQTEVVVVDRASRRLLTLSADPRQPGHCICQAGGATDGFQHLDSVLASRADRFGTRYLGLAPWPGTRLLYTVGPILDSAGTVAGAMVVGERLDAVLAEVQQRAAVAVAAFGSDQTLLGRSAGLDLRSAQHSARVVEVPWVLRFQTQGHLALALPPGPSTGPQTILLLILLGVGLAALVLTLGAGFFISRSITRPLGAILEATHLVAKGNLKYRAPVESGDEIGRVASSFNGMIETLDERSGRLAGNMRTPCWRWPRLSTRAMRTPTAIPSASPFTAARWPPPPGLSWATSKRSSGAASSTTSARSAFPTNFSLSPAASAAKSRRRCAGTRWSATGCSPGWAGRMTSSRSCCTTMSAGTAAATRAAWHKTRSRYWPGWWRSRTRSTP